MSVHRGRPEVAVVRSDRREMTRSRNRPLLVFAGIEFRALPGDHGVPPRTNAAQPLVIAVHHLERGTASFARRRQAHEQLIIKVHFGRSPRKRQHRGNGGQTGEFSKTRLLIAHRICAARHKFALPSGRRLCSLWLPDLSPIISAPAPKSAREEVPLGVDPHDSRRSRCSCVHLEWQPWCRT
jgi:hypothetical protein